MQPARQYTLGYLAIFLCADPDPRVNTRAETVPVVQVQVYRGYGYGYIAGKSTGHTHSTRGLPGLLPSASGARYTIVAVVQPSRKCTRVGEKATNHNGEALLYVFSDDIGVKGVDSSDGDEIVNIHRKLTPR